MMNEQQIKLDMIDPNPWQPRQGEDAAHIRKIALSIAEQGLMQTPVGRYVDENFDRVQLAFGHSRLAAYKLLARVEAALRAGQAVDDDLTGDEYDNLLAAADRAVEAGKTFVTMPVQVVTLTDEQMFAQGISENIARKDLTAFEEAQAMARYRDDFNKNSGQIGALFGLADSTVRNKLRLLELPEKIREQAAGLAENVLRELVSMYALPAVVRNLVHYERNFPSLVQDALDGKLTGPQLHEAFGRFILDSGKDMSQAPWKFDREFLGVENEIGSLDYPDCKTCEARIQVNGKNICVRTGCYFRRWNIWIKEYLEQASQASGIPVGDEKLQTAQSWGGAYTAWEYRGEAERVGQVLATRCSNLRLKYERTRTSAERPDSVAGFPQAQVVCQKRKGGCVCDRALEIRGAQPVPAVSVETGGKTLLVTVFDNQGDESQVELEQVAEIIQPEQEPLTEERLKEIAQATRRQARHNLEVVRSMEDQAVVALFGATENPEFWRILLRRVGSFQKANDMAKASLMDVKAALFRAVLQYQVLDVANSPDAQKDPAKCEQRYKEFLGRMGLDLPWSVGEAEE